MSFLENSLLMEGDLIGRLYTHSSCVGIYGKETPRDYLLENFNKCPLSFNVKDFFLAIAWGTNDKKMVDFFKYSGVNKNWNSNPEIIYYLLENSIWKASSNITCGDGIILLGEEEKFRRKTKTILGYFSQSPNLKEINNLLSFDK